MTIRSSAWFDKIESGIAGIGGTALLEGILERIEQSTGLSVRLGNIKINSPNREALDLQAAAAAGLLFYWAQSSEKDYLRSCFIGRNHVERSFNLVRHLFQEYF